MSESQSFPSKPFTFVTFYFISVLKTGLSYNEQRNIITSYRKTLGYDENYLVEFRQLLQKKALAQVEYIQPQLQQYLLRMLNPSIFRAFLIPTIYYAKKAQNPNKYDIKTLQPTTLSNSLEACQKKQYIPEPKSTINQLQIKITTETTQSDQEQEILEISQQQVAFVSSQNMLERNCISKRVNFLQYEANNPCEDSIFFGQLNTINAYTVSIFDGHGGPQLAEYSKEKINCFIDSFLQENVLKSQGKSIGEIIKGALKWSYQQLEDTFYSQYQQQIKIGNKRIKNVGTCAITAIVHNDRVYVGNSGDSQGIFIISDSKNHIRTEKINERHNLNNKVERQRIVQKFKDIDQNIIVEEANNSYYLKGRLQPTKTIGDYYLKKEKHYSDEGTFKGPYLQCDPEITEYQLTKEHKYMVIASDGVWDVLSRNEVISSLMKQKEFDVTKTLYQQKEERPFLSNILSDILQRSSEMTGKPLEQLKRMEKGKRRNYHDDITIAIVDLQNQV